MASSSASKYDVFLSFRGEDTRRAIVSHLNAALTLRGISTFKDDKRLELGDKISDELHKAIQGSDFAVVVLSENYATSIWCLTELQLIMELHRQGRLGVIPVFYGVEPSSVRHQQGSFDLMRYQRPELADRVPMWRQALELIANHTGVESNLCTDEAAMVGKIAQDISRRKALMRYIDFRNIVGGDTHMQGLKSLLDMDSENVEVRMIGIWGMGGIGKSTIAKCLYAQSALKFEASYFTQDMKGIHKDIDLLDLQDKFLYSTLGEKISLWSVEAGRNEINARVGHKKVLLVLDGVDKVSQVHALAKERSWFGPRSRIIITTRDKGLLNSCGVKTIYEVKCLDEKDSLQMFKQIAFEGGTPPSDGFEQLSIRAASLGQGLPSAIQANALFLRGRDNSLEEWKEAICGLESSPDENTMEILKLSYEGLSRRYKKVFLLVACLFNGEPYQRVISLVDGLRLEKSLGIRVLAEKSLINITTTRYVILHKLVEQMGREIMLDRNSFLGDPENIYHVLVSGAGTELTECISLHTCEMTYEFSMKTSVLNSMHKLRFLKVYKHVDVRESRLQITTDDRYLHLNYSLRLLHWDAFPLNTLHFMCSQHFLVELSLRHSNLKTLWSGNLFFSNLKKLDVTGSKNLKQLPVLSDIHSLDELILQQCPRLKGIPESIGYESSLRRLNLSHYGGTKNPMHVVIRKVSGTQRIKLQFPSAEVEMQLLNISIAGDIKFHFSEGCRGYAEYFSFSSERQIHVTASTHVQQDPRLLTELKKYKALNIRRFNYKENGRPVAFHSFPDIPDMKELKLINLNIHLLPVETAHLEFLEKLDFSGNDFYYLPADTSRLSQLKTLRLLNCRKLEELPELTQVQSINVFNCKNLRSLVKLSDASSRSYRLLELCLDNCKNITSLSDQLSHFAMLTYLDLSSHDFDTLPSSIRDLTSLVTLCLNYCKNLKSVEALPLSLQFLYAHGCDSLEDDDVKHFKGKLCKEVPAQPHSPCSQETDMASDERDLKAMKSHLLKFLRCSDFESFLMVVLLILLLHFILICFTLL